MLKPFLNMNVPKPKCKLRTHLVAQFCYVK